MTTLSAMSSESTQDSPTTKIVSQKFALLAKVGHQKKRLSLLHDEMDYYSGIASELLVFVVELLDQMDNLPEGAVPLEAELANKLKLSRLVKNLLSTYPDDLELQEVRSTLLTYDGLESVVTLTDAGYLTQSTEQMLDLVGLSLGATKDDFRKH